MSSDYFFLLVMVFSAVFMMTMALVVPSFGVNAKSAKRMRARLREVAETLDPEAQLLLRNRYHKGLSAFEKKLERLPGMSKLREWIEQSGRDFPAYRLVGIALVLAVTGAGVTMFFSHLPFLPIVVGLLLFLVPVLKLKFDRDKRLARCEEQLPEAMDIMTRALRAGHPFNETLSLVADELPDPIASEFRRTFSDINYGMHVKVAFIDLLRRIPSMSLLAVTTAVLIQREVGGNTAEILGKIAHVVRGRFRFQRRVKTLSAEGRMSAWVLMLIPFFLAGVLMLTSPDYLTVMTKDPRGVNLILIGFTLQMLGLLWIRRIIRIDM